MEWGMHTAKNHQNKSSAVAEMGDRARAKWAEKWEGAGVPLSDAEAGSPSKYRLGPGLPPYQVAS